MPLNPLDRERLWQALEAAEAAIGLSDPNPRVGCVVGSDDGRVFGIGSTQEAGGPHAEVMALRAAVAAGANLRGATAWVTLEPCAHHGRTPPCADALVAAGIARVVVAIGDPFPQVDGHGMARLCAAGVEVVLADGALADAARDLNIGFFSRVQRGRPWVRMKIAASLDGRTALPDGRSQWITGPEARADGHAWRKRAGAVLTGIGTVLHDDPRFDVRSVPTRRQPLRAVLDSELRLPLTSKLFDAQGGVLVFGADAPAERASALRQRGAEVVLCAGADGHVALDAVLNELTARKINEVHVEAGERLNGALLDAELVDELLLYLAPKLLGDGRGMARLSPLRKLAEAPPFHVVDMRLVGEDLRLQLRRSTASGFFTSAKALE
ncbi:MAG: bifunctional diaminohydroxyphosphoribosylaminopyrimidine deaminase/5-amino-6-(5-phosphoribosylamino)uracil reductase RibD [Burkholderiaceae bacterium]|nr:bifunctional diaminohydroxyphosphoribosylaminopyrimidine deaminase/5-amino-6-(5-phosphoribosylamino)uracil reductase RibD [Burkholderiaceae bacterium]